MTARHLLLQRQALHDRVSVINYARTKREYGWPKGA